MLELKDICVNFSYKTVLDGVSISFEKGKIYSLLGENGAGKSTLAHVICGDLQQTSGEMSLNGKKIHFKSPKEAIKNGIVCVHQRPLLASSISIEDNIKIGLNRTQLKNFTEQKKDFLKKWLQKREFSDKVFQLKNEETFFVALIAALCKNPKILILDEPPEISKEKLKTLAESGITILIITHHLQQAISLSDFVVLLKDGKILQEAKSSEITKEQIEQKLFGISKEIPLPAFIKTQKVSEKDILEKRNVLKCRKCAGLKKTQRNFETGLIPSDSVFTASNPNLTILQMITAFHPNGKQAELKQKAEGILHKAEVKIKLHEKASCLSGGMLQRIILERELAENPKKIYLFNATHGLDVEATQKLYSKLENLSKKGTEIVFGTD